MLRRNSKDSGPRAMPLYHSIPALRQRLFRALHPGSEKRRLMREGTWVLLGSVAKAAATVGGVRLVTEVLPRDVFGAANLLLGGVMLVFNVLAYPLLQSVARLYPDAESLGTVRALRALILKVLFALTALISLGGGVWLVSGGAGTDLRGSSGLIYLALVCILAIQPVMTVELALLRAARRQKASSLWTAGTAILRPLATAGLVVVLGATSHVVLGAYAVALGATTALALLLRRPWPQDATRHPNDATLPRLRREIVSYGLPLAPMIAMSWVLTLSDRYIIAWQAGATATGLYAAAYGIITTPFMMSQGTLAATLRPVYNSAISRGNRALEIKTYAMWLGLTTLICLGGIGLALFLSPWVARVFLAPEYRAAAAFMPWLALGAALQAISQVVESVLYGHKRTALLPFGYAITTTFCLAVTVVLVRSHGAIGAAWAYGMTYGLHTILFALLARLALARNRGTDTGETDTP